jgi:signal transduction histidine kinase
VGYVVSRDSHDRDLLASRAAAVNVSAAAMITDAGGQAEAVAALFRASNEVTESEFEGFIQDIGLTEGMFGLGFVAAVDRADLAAFEETLSRNHPGAFVFEVDGIEQVPVGERDSYRPIQFFYSVDDLPAWGYDSASDPDFSVAVEQALATGELTASGFLTFPGRPGSQGWVMFEAASGPGGLVLGVVATAMDLEAVLAAAIPAGVGSDLDLTIHDLTETTPRVPEGAWSETIRVANRTWRIDVMPGPHGSPTWGALAFVAGGLITGSALATAVLAAGSRRRQRREMEDLRTLDREKDDFLATVSHELRTPLTSIVGFAEALRGGNGELSRADQVEMIDFIADEADAMEGIVQDLLAVARLQQGGAVPISCRPVVDLAAEVRRIAEQAAIVRSSPTTVSGNAAVFVDPARLGQILRNVFDNAVRHGRAPIEVRIMTDGEKVRVTLRDSGPGVASAEVSRLFERYRSGPNPEGLPTSTGIGLWLSRELALLMGGDLIYVPSEKGAVFELSLPVSRVRESVEPAALDVKAVGF